MFNPECHNHSGGAQARHSRRSATIHVHDAPQWWADKLYIRLQRSLVPSVVSTSHKAQNVEVEGHCEDYC
ncbi:hypothetical protein M405DRAFT_811962 [Rhizopogon salebrosus TDB-379]|nr:hypothetical protein M405DRAFT_811962 [Rhizopogon salebrosus TDB-379]